MSKAYGGSHGLGNVCLVRLIKIRGRADVAVSGRLAIGGTTALLHKPGERAGKATGWVHMVSCTDLQRAAMFM